MPTKRNRRVGVQSRKVKKQKLSRKLSVSGKAKKRRSSTHGSSTHRSGTRRRVQRGGDPFATGSLYFLSAVAALGIFCAWSGVCPWDKNGNGEKEVQYSYS